MKSFDRKRFAKALDHIEQQIKRPEADHVSGFEPVLV
jgi:hypothetical protein